jgi:(1->4)-alpha-D-glucan 1-alpha-D-glucosylmutase
MLTTATHDHKRGEDARARIAVLSHLPGAWEEFVAAMPAAPGIHSADSYQLYQTLLGAWPGENPAEEFVARVQGWCGKYLREAKLRSSWGASDAAYEARFSDLARDLILAEAAAPFRALLSALLVRIRPLAQAHMLLQLVLRNCVPGVPDLYQGCEFADLSLVDPDNRRPVDFAARTRALTENFCPKQSAIARLLAARRDDPDLWARGDYRPLILPEASSDVLAFSRRHAQSHLVVIGLTRLGQAQGALQLDVAYRELLTGKDFSAGQVTLADLLEECPAAVLYARGES